MANEYERAFQSAIRFHSVALVNRLEAKYLRQDGVKHAIGTIFINAISIAAVIAILIASTESLAEVIVVVVSLNVITVVAVVRVLIAVRTPVIGTPAIFAVCRSGVKSFLVTVVHRLAKRVRAILIRLVVVAATLVAIDRSCVEVRISIVIGVPVILEKYLLLLQASHILFLNLVLRPTPLLLQLSRLLLQDTLLLIQMFTVLGQALLLLCNQLLLTLL